MPPSNTHRHKLGKQWQITYNDPKKICFPILCKKTHLDLESHKNQESAAGIGKGEKTKEHNKNPEENPKILCEVLAKTSEFCPKCEWVKKKNKTCKNWGPKNCNRKGNHVDFLLLKINIPGVKPRSSLF